MSFIDEEGMKALAQCGFSFAEFERYWEENGPRIAAAFREFGSTWQASVDSELATSPEFTELNVYLDRWYGDADRG